MLNLETQKKQRRRNPDERHVIAKNPELRIIPQELWDTAQRARSARAVHMWPHRQAATSPRDCAQQ
ncbi:recombinase family protein [Bradyrhizobium sp. RDM12]